MEFNTQTILIVFVAFTGISVLLQACVLFGIYLSLKKSAQAVLEATEDLKATVLPIVHSTRELTERISPQVVTVTAGLAELVELLRKESAGVSYSASEIMGRMNRQTQRLDALLTITLNTIERASVSLETAVAVPVRQANGIAAAIRAALESYSRPVRKQG